MTFAEVTHVFKIYFVQETTLTGASVAPISEVCKASMFVLLLMLRNWKSTEDGTVFVSVS